MPWPAALKTFEPPDSEYAWENAVSVKGFIIPNQIPAAFFQQMSVQPKSSSTSDIFSSALTRHTIIIYISNG
jgi:hypothetical protein